MLDGIHAGPGRHHAAITPPELAGGVSTHHSSDGGGGSRPIAGRELRTTRNHGLLHPSNMKVTVKRHQSSGSRVVSRRRRRHGGGGGGGGLRWAATVHGGASTTTSTTTTTSSIIGSDSSLCVVSVTLVVVNGLRLRDHHRQTVADIDQLHFLFPFSVQLQAVQQSRQQEVVVSPSSCRPV